MIKKYIKKFFPTEQERMNNFLSQAVDIVHLEMLQREWDRMSYEKRSSY
jgi:hypothetical protein